MKRLLLCLKIKQDFRKKDSCDLCGHSAALVESLPEQTSADCWRSVRSVKVPLLDGRMDGRTDRLLGELPPPPPPPDSADEWQCAKANKRQRLGASGWGQWGGGGGRRGGPALFMAAGRKSPECDGPYMFVI